MNSDLTGKVALVTGSSGRIGKAIALRLADGGADLIVTGRNEEPGRRVVEQIEAKGRKAVFQQGDLTRYADVERMVKGGLDHFGRIDLLVASASGRQANPLPFKPFSEIPPEDYYGYALSHWFAKAYPIRAVLDHMVERRAGKIVVVTTDAGRTATVGESILGGAGAATIQMMKVLAKEFLRWNLRINAIAVSIVDTSGGEESQPGARGAGPAFAGKILDRLKEKQVYPVRGDDVAEAAAYLASPAADQVTGQVLSVNGGISVP